MEMYNFKNTRVATKHNPMPVNEAPGGSCSYDSQCNGLRKCALIGHRCTGNAGISGIDYIVGGQAAAAQ